MTVTITDEHTDNVATVEAHDVAETIGPWFPDAPAEITQAIAELEIALLRHDPVDGLAEYLGLTVKQA